MTCFDFEEDGRPDFLVVADDGENGLGGWGVAYVVNGASAGEVPLAWSSARILGDADSMGFVGVDVTQDITGDGIADLVIGDYLYPDGFDTPGKVWVLGLNPPGVPGGDLSLGDAQATILGQWDYSRTGTSATALGDIRHIDRLRLPGAGLWRLHSN